MKGFPRGMRHSTLEERRAFYEDEFDVRAVARWIGSRSRTMKFAMIPGRHTGIVTEDHRIDRDNVVTIDIWEHASDLRDYALEYLPEGLYYDRNRYKDVSACAECGDCPRRCPTCHNVVGQQLAFDIDPENIDCPYHGDIGEKMRSGRGLSFCMLEFKAARAQAGSLRARLRGEYEQVSVVYSGRGFHVVVDDESAYVLTRRERREIAREIGEEYDIDEWVTTGGSRLMRLPHSLNGIVSRICSPIKGERDLRGLDPRTESCVIPLFLKSA